MQIARALGAKTNSRFLPRFIPQSRCCEQRVKLIRTDAGCYCTHSHCSISLSCSSLFERTWDCTHFDGMWQLLTSLIIINNNQKCQNMFSLINMTSVLLFYCLIVMHIRSRLLRQSAIFQTLCFLCLIYLMCLKQSTKVHCLTITVNLLNRLCICNQQSIM